MPYQIEPNLWNGVFAVPDKIVDEHLKLCGAAALKALLLILRRGGEADTPEIAGVLSLPPADVHDAINYWIHLGVLRQTGAAQEAAIPVVTLEYTSEGPKEGSGLISSPPEKPQEKPGASRRRLSSGQIGEMSRSDENIAYLLQEAQGVLGEPLGPVGSETVAALYSYYGMQPDLILMLLGYCVSIGKTSMRYIEKVAAGWIEQGIDSHEKAEGEIIKTQNRNSIERKIQKMMGIADRALIAREQEYIRKWIEQWGMSYDLIMLAYERNVELKGKLSFAYMNGILQNWKEKGAFTPKQALLDIQSGKGKKQHVAEAGSTSYDIGELENLVYGRSAEGG